MTEEITGFNTAAARSPLPHLPEYFTGNIPLHPSGWMDEIDKIRNHARGLETKQEKSAISQKIVTLFFDKVSDCPDFYKSNLLRRRF